MSACPRPPWAVRSHYLLGSRFGQGSSSPFRHPPGAMASHRRLPERLAVLLRLLVRGQAPLSERDGHDGNLLRGHPGTVSGGLSRRIRSRMARKSHRGTATSAIWKITFKSTRPKFGTLPPPPVDLGLRQHHDPPAPPLGQVTPAARLSGQLRPSVGILAAVHIGRWAHPRSSAHRTIQRMMRSTGLPIRLW